jgi:DNA-binding protein HU-beta
VNKRELVEAIAEQTDASKKQVEDVLDRFMETVAATLKKGERIALSPFGVFERRERAARTGQNPQTGEKIRIKAAKVPAFKAGKGLKDAVAGPARKSSAKKSSAKKSSAKKSSAKKAAPKKAAKKAGAKKAAPKKAAKKAGAKKAAPKKAAPKKTAPKKTAPKKTAKKAAAKKSTKKSVKKG